ncbi:hypothetical protein [Streptomyces sp. NPDC058411]|uniref:hypothetical protein n=1 Tax=Streptomyces sp. NPDC058411 TaxID=3346485 RepID=UPI003656F6E8
MTIPLWVLAVLIPELMLTCLLLRWLPAKRERWIAALPLPVTAVSALALRLTEVSWPDTLASCTGFLWGVMLALAPFSGWVSSWTLPSHGEARLRGREVALVLMGVVTPLSVKGSDAALEKAFSVRQVVRDRGQFPLVMGVALLVVPVTAAVGVGWVTNYAGWA